MLEINLQKIKFWGMILFIQLGSFVGGMYAGKEYLSVTELNKSFINYTTPSLEIPKDQNTPREQLSQTENCPIKGNISSKSKIYHVKGGSFYDRTTAEMCFNTENEAQDAGFIKSSR